MSPIAGRVKKIDMRRGMGVLRHSAVLQPGDQVMVMLDEDGEPKSVIHRVTYSAQTYPPSFASFVRASHRC